MIPAKVFCETDSAIFSTAVVDYRPNERSDYKIKKAGNTLIMVFIKNQDIAYEFGQVKSVNQISVGFAPETHDVEENATKKLEGKHFDMIVINSPKRTKDQDTIPIEYLIKN